MGSRFVSLALVFFALLPGVPGFECPPPPKVRQALATATAVFSGKVVSQEYVDVHTDSSDKASEPKAVVVKLKAERWWKGNGSREVLLYTSVRKYPSGTTSMMADDFTFRQDESYLVYAYGPEKELRTSRCTRTKKLADAEDDLRELGAGKEFDEEQIGQVVRGAAWANSLRLESYGSDCHANCRSATSFSNCDT